MITTPTDPTQHEWFSFDDDEGTWLFDLSFLASRWSCRFADGCPGVLTEAAPELAEGCCSYGAHFASKPERKRVRAAAERLTDAQWEKRPALGDRKPVVKGESGTWTTRLLDDTCVFVNSPEFAGGPGCALHRGALEAGERPMDWKPDVCWQVPLRFEQHVDDNGHTTFTLREWKRRDWGEGGSEFHSWCIEEPETYSGIVTVAESMRDELIELIGEDRYQRVAEYLRNRPRVRFLPYPTRR